MPIPAIGLAALAAGGTGFGLSRLLGRGGSGGGTHFDPASWYDKGEGKTFEPDRIRFIYQQALGREPNNNEIEQFKKYLEAGDLQYQDVAEIVSGLPEAQKSRLNAYTTDLEQRLGANDQAILGRGLEQLESRYRQLGRSESTGLASSFARTAGDLALERQGALNAFYGGGLNSLQNAYSQRATESRARGYDLENRRYDFNNSLTLARLGAAYQDQRDDKSLAIQRSQAQGQLFGTVAGAGLGYAATGGNPLGAYVGGQLGSGIGQNYGLLRR